MTATQTLSPTAKDIRRTAKRLGNGNPARIAAVMDNMWDRGRQITKQDLHAALVELATAGLALIEPEPKLRSLTAKDKDLAIELGGDKKHLITITG